MKYIVFTLTLLCPLVATNCYAQPIISGTVPIGSGRELYYEMQGTGEPLVLIHGITLDRRMWDAQFDHFATDYRVIRYDVVGHGNSSGLDGPIPEGSVPRWDHLRDLLDTLNVDKAHVVGMSMGGLVAIDFAIEHPQRVRTLTSIGGGPDGYEWDMTAGGFFDRNVGYYTTSFNQGVEVALPLWLNDPLFAPANSNPTLRARLEEIVIQGHGALGDGAMFQWPNPTKLASLDPVARSRLSEISVPTLVTVGELDLFDFQEQANILDLEISDSTKVVIQGAGHMANMEQPQLVNAALSDFLESNEFLPDCDFDTDRDCDLDDIDQLVSEIATMTNGSSFDLTGDGFVDHSDLDHWLRIAGAWDLPSGATYLVGDFDLDGAVDVTDFNLWNNNKFSANGLWSGGDANADGFVDVGDFNIWNDNKFTSADVATVPEPSGVAIAILFGFIIVAFRAAKKARGRSRM